MKRFFYNVNGTEFEDTVAFGDGWKKALALAKKEHTEITRTVIINNDIRYEFFAKGGVFLNDRFYSKDKVEIF